MSLLTKIRRKSLRTVNEIQADIRHTLHLDRNFFREARGKRIILYHGVCVRDHLRFNTLFLTKKVFEEQLKFFCDYFNVITLDEFYADASSDEKFNVCLTFDDGFANNFDFVLPLLQKYKVRATFFVTAIRAAGYDILWNDFLSIISVYGPSQITINDSTYEKSRRNQYISKRTGKTLNETLRAGGFEAKAEMMQLLSRYAQFKARDSDTAYWLQMTTDQIRALAASPYASLGSHGYYHNDLSELGPVELARELVESMQYLQDLSEKKIDSIAFPYGAYNDAVVKEAKSSGYKKILVTDFINASDASDPQLRARMTVNPYISLPNQMKAIVRGRYE
jgi:peptidoglycan/xylan/chitin deacetylase (PgdA/CDA1 family)